jgi:hypothetical protein
MPKIESRAAERVRPVAPQPRPTPKQEAGAQESRNFAEFGMPMRDQVQVFDHTLNKFNEFGKQCRWKLLKRQERREGPVPFSTAVHLNPQGCLLRLMGPMTKPWTLEPIYQRAKKTGKAGRAGAAKSQRLQSRPTAGHTPSSTR